MRHHLTDKNVQVAFAWGLITGLIVSGIMVMGFAYGMKVQMDRQEIPALKFKAVTKVMV